jgi:hypothetical protein
LREWTALINAATLAAALPKLWWWQAADRAAAAARRASAACCANHDGSPARMVQDRSTIGFFASAGSTSRSRLVPAQRQRIAQSINDETTLSVDDKSRRLQFLEQHSLLQANHRTRLTACAPVSKCRKTHEWLLHNYLFFRIP